jgi:hypothetical protein
MAATSALAQEMQLTIPPRHARELVSLISRSRKLSAFALRRDGQTHSYHFPLQPRDLALRDIEANCCGQKS